MKIFLKKATTIYLVSWITITILWKLGGLLTPINPQSADMLNSPSWIHIFGTDALGRDLSARILEGGFNSFFVTIVSSLLNMFLAVLVGVLISWYRPESKIIITVLDLLQALPAYVLTAVVFIMVEGLGFGGNGIWALSLALGLTHWMVPARIFRSQTLQLSKTEFILASRSLGANGWDIIKIHLPRHFKNSFLVLWALQIPVLLMYESFMSFIGFGVASPQTSWGLLLQEGWRYLSDYPHLLLGPGAVLFSVLLCLNYLFDSYRNRWGQESF